ncbi:hypothetical protein [Haloplanus sp. GCM10025708]|uniref:hypothetical protein n=1 Tax=Haloplanus sp. GCM10025708 TaxID=3252679 RepID=UPI0036D2B5C3
MPVQDVILKLSLLDEMLTELVRSVRQWMSAITVSDETKIALVAIGVLLVFGYFFVLPVYDVAAIPILLSRSKHGRCNRIPQKQMTGLLSAKTVAHGIPSDIDTATIVSTGYLRRFGDPGTMIECLTSESPRGSRPGAFAPTRCTPLHYPKPGNWLYKLLPGR